MAKIMPTAPRLDYEVVEAVPARKLKDVLNRYSEQGWSHYAFLRGRMGAWDCVFVRVLNIGEEDRVDRLLKDNSHLPFQRVND